MKNPRLFVPLIVFFVLQTGLSYAQTVMGDIKVGKQTVPIVREPNPCKVLETKNNQLDVLAGTGNALKPVLKKGRTPSGELEKLSPQEQYVSMFVMTTLGPIGKAFIRNDFGEYVKLPDEEDPKRKIPFIYPSLYFDISASPLLVGVSGDNENLYALRDVNNQKNEMMWMDVTFELFPYCKDKNEKPTPCVCTSSEKVTYCDEPEIRVLSILPNETVSGARDSIPGQIAGAASELAALSQPFYASSTFGVKSDSVTKGVSVLFNNLFPPKPFTYQHAYISSASKFGWNFHNQSRLKESKTVSLMGLHRTAAVLQVREDVQLIGVRYYSLSKWSKRPNVFSDKFDLRSDGLCIELPEKQEEAKTDYQKLTNLEKFPLLISKAEVCKIFHTTEGNACDSLIKYLTGYNADGTERSGIRNADGSINRERIVETTPDGNYIIKPSLEKYLGLQKNGAKEAEKPK